MENHEKINIASDEGSVVMLSQDDYESMQETLRLIANKKSLQALLVGHAERDRGRFPEGASPENIFNDL